MYLTAIDAMIIVIALLTTAWGFYWWGCWRGYRQANEELDSMEDPDHTICDLCGAKTKFGTTAKGKITVHCTKCPNWYTTDRLARPTLRTSSEDAVPGNGNG